MKKIIMLGLLCLFLVACNGMVNIESAARVASDFYDIDIETMSTDRGFTPASIESQARAKTQAKYIGADTSNIGDPGLGVAPTHPEMIPYQGGYGISPVGGSIGGEIHSGTAQIHECLFDQIGGKCYLQKLKNSKTNLKLKISMTKAEIFKLYEQAYEEGYQDALWLIIPKENSK